MGLALTGVEFKYLLEPLPCRTQVILAYRKLGYPVESRDALAGLSGVQLDVLQALVGAEVIRVRLEHCLDMMNSFILEPVFKIYLGLGEVFLYLILGKFARLPLDRGRLLNRHLIFGKSLQDFNRSSHHFLFQELWLLFWLGLCRGLWRGLWTEDSQGIPVIGFDLENLAQGILCLLVQCLALVFRGQGF